MEPFSGFHALVLSLPQPVILAVGVVTRSNRARPGRHPVQDRPQDRGIRFRPAVRPVQHLQPLFDDRILGQRPHGVIGKSGDVFPC